MNDELRVLLFRYVNNNMFADYNFVKEVINIFIEKYGNNGIRMVINISEKQKGVSDFENGVIGINLEYIKSELIKYNWYDNMSLNLYLFNISVILVLKHEFNHFRQIKKYKDVVNSNNFLDKLFVNSFVMICSSNVDLINLYNNTKYVDSLEVDKFYNEYHDCFAAERIAQVDAYRSIIELILPLKNELNQVYYYYLYEYYFYRLKDYCLIDDVVLAPVDKILFQMENYFQYQDELILDDEHDDNVSEFYNNIINNYTVNDRFRYGLPITVKEYIDSLDFIKVMYILGVSAQDNVKIKKRYFDKKTNQ